MNENKFLYLLGLAEHYDSRSDYYCAIDKLTAEELQTLLNILQITSKQAFSPAEKLQAARKMKDRKFPTGLKEAS